MHGLCTFALSGAMLAAGDPAPSGPAAPASAETKIQASEADDAARFLAGLAGRASSPYKALEAEGAWQEHVRAMDELWAKYARRRKPAMEKFQAAELTGAPIDGATVWYPFSGPDVLTMVAFFPGHQSYVMAALEPPGTVPRASDFKPGSLAGKLPAIRATLSSQLRESFFVTQEMDRELRGQATDGVTQPILIQLARLAYTVHAYRYLELDAQGRLVAREKDQKRAQWGHNLAIAFDVSKDGGAVETLLYISLNLDDAHMKDNPSFHAYVRALPSTVTMLKATSYMTHDDKFTLIRDLILERSAAIIQDDSGIPWRFLADAWQVQLYGDYTKPYGSFHFRVQPDLRERYERQRQSVKPLDFPVGYGAGRITSNLQVARRQTAAEKPRP